MDFSSLHLLSQTAHYFAGRNQFHRHRRKSIGDELPVGGLHLAASEHSVIHGECSFPFTRTFLIRSIRSTDNRRFGVGIPKPIKRLGVDALTWLGAVIVRGLRGWKGSRQSDVLFDLPGFVAIRGAFSQTVTV